MAVSEKRLQELLDKEAKLEKQKEYHKKAHARRNARIALKVAYADSKGYNPSDADIAKQMNK